MTVAFRAKAYAKINLTLEVIGRRPDGFHDIASVMSTISLCDELILRPSDRWQISVDAPEPLRSELDAGDNLVQRAVMEFVAARDALPRSRMSTPATWPPSESRVPPAHLHLVKRIPAAAGLGGGSSDAAHTLWLLNGQVEGNDGSRISEPQLRAAAARIGSDVPFFLDGGVQCATGRGDTLRRLPDLDRQWLVVLTPPLALERKTARMYALLTAEQYSDGARMAALADRIDRAPSTPLSDSDFVNVFERVAYQAFPGMSTFARRLTDATGSPAHLSGAGPSLFALCADEAAAKSAAAGLVASGLAAWAVHTVPGNSSVTGVEC
ncbi:MAG: 4-(cytidine 5'-diphospho)-2-C-methyl-D-erythritol kinase [Chloroflexi bacterium]|nr:4-(cytidine 5'-diphospho)-2-C-methyl-D-erythritol kinase [Chloroflexota bacterium]